MGKCLLPQSISFKPVETLVYAGVTRREDGNLTPETLQDTEEGRVWDHGHRPSHTSPFRPRVRSGPRVWVGHMSRPRVSVLDGKSRTPKGDG